MRYKVLFLPSWYPSRVHPVSGIFIKRHAQAVSKYCDVAVLYIRSIKDLKGKTYDVEYCEEDGIPTVRVYYKRVNSNPLFQPIEFARYIKSAYLGLKIIKEKFGRPDIVHVNVVFPAGILALILKLLKKIPYIVSEHTSIYLFADSRYKNSSLIMKLITYLIIKNSQVVTTVSTALKEAMLGHRLSNRYYVIPNVVEIDIKQIIPKNIKKQKKKIVHISLLNDKEKNVSGILNALHSIIQDKRRNDFELHIIGDGVDRQKLEDLAKKLNLLNSYVFFWGMKKPEEVYRFLQISDFLITNSNFETFSVATAEAIACGIPVIATKCGGPEDFVTEEVGILIEPGNQKQLEEAILYMLDNCDKYDKKKLIEYAKSRFSYEVVGKQFYDLYTYVICEARSKPSLIKFGEKKLEYYKDFIIKADNKLHDQIVVELLKNCPPPAKVLDFGCGEGALSERLKDLWYEVISSDIDDSNFKAKTEFVKLDFNDCESMRKFASENRKKFDVVLSIEVLEHIENIFLYIDTIQEVLKTGGLLIMSTPNISSFISRLFFLYKGIPHQFSKNDLEGYGHINPISSLEIEYLLRRKGFDILKIKEGGDLPFLWFRKSINYTLSHFAGLLLYAFMKGVKRSWCLIIIGKKVHD